MKKNIGNNAVLNGLRQCLAVLFPLITYPYVIRVLGAEGIGKINFAQSIINYFSLFAMLGVSNYVIREGSKRKDNRENFINFTNEVFTINLISTAIAYVLLGLAILFVGKLRDYSALLCLQSVSIILTTIGVDWINSVYEDFLFITIRSIASHIITLILTFVLIKKPDDIYLYAFLSVLTNGIICVTNWYYCRKYIKLRIVRQPNIKRHIKPLLVLFANSIAVTIYISADTTMLGWMKGDYYVGLYSLPVKIYMMIKGILVAIYIVSMPRLSFYAGNGMDKEFKNLYSDLWGYMSLVLLPAGIGIICVAPGIIDLMGGLEYSSATLALQILAGALICAIYGGLVSGCFNIARGREKENLKATVISASFNIILNFICIPLFAHNGAAFTTLLSELFVFMFNLIRIPNKKKFFEYKKILKCILHILIGCSAIIVISVIVRMIIQTCIPQMIVTVLLSIIMYIIIMLIFKDYYFMNVVSALKDKYSPPKKQK